LLILIDDEPVTSRTLALDLADAGYRVDTAADAGEVLRRLRSHPVDLLIAAESRDEEESRMIDEAQRIRPHTKVVLLTTSAETEAPGTPAKAVARVRKPFDLEEFRAVVGRLLGEVETNGSAK
jgi:DNA-binding response OmpR family regulator